MAGALVLAGGARRLALAAGSLGLVCPSFRSPPRLAGADRSLRRRAPGAPLLVSVRLRGRGRAEVLADMVEGVVVANGLVGEDARRARAALWSALAPERHRAA
ncbi:MAG TPA: hypothetical protein VNT56_12420 [Acidimicrobiales bacterium]|nr:hypothetical protein [Acidimicrobiales bacterium]